jgi:WD40 repeat protein
MKLVEGGSLASRVKDYLADPRAGAALLEVVACAVQHAHARGILHRDLKPSNILLDGEGRPLVSDFGLSKRVEGSTELTASNAIVGTAPYMAPEQARAEKGLTTAIDVYALGAILYELLTGRPPFKADTAMETVLQVLTQEPAPPRQVRPGAPPDLETICLKCLQKDPRHRYLSAGEVGDDLRRFLEGKPIAARPVSLPEQAWRWAKRNKALAGTLATVAVLVVFLAVGSTVSAFLYRGERDRAVEAEGEAEAHAEQADKARQEVQRQLVKALASVAGEVRAMRLRGERGAYFRGMPKLKAALARARELDAPEEVIGAIRNEMGNLFTVEDIEVTREWDDFPPGTDGHGFSPNLDRYNRLRRDGLLTVHETGTGKELSRLPFKVVKAEHGRFSPDGRLFVLNAGGGRVLCFGVDVPKAALRWQAPGRGPCYLTPDGKLALYAHPDNTTRIVDAQSGKEVRRLTQGGLFAMNPVHPSRPWVALYAHRDKAFIAVDYQTGKQVGKLMHSSSNTCVCWHPSAPILAGADRTDLRIRLWDVTTGRQVVQPFLGQTHDGVTPAFDRTGRYLLTTEWGEIARVWDAVTGRLSFQSKLRVGNLVSGPNGEWAATSQGQKLQTFRVYPGEGLRVIAPADWASSGFGRVAVEPSGRVITFHRPGNKTTILDAEKGRELGTLPGKTDLIASANGDGSLLTLGERGLEQWPLRLAGGVCRVGPPERIILPRYNGGTWGMSADGQVVAVPDYGRGAFVWDRKRPAEVQQTAPQNDVRHVALSPDGRWIVAASHVVGGVSVSDARTGKFIRWLISDGGAAVFSAGGRWLSPAGLARGNDALPNKNLGASPPARKRRGRVFPG